MEWFVFFFELWVDVCWYEFGECECLVEVV